MSNQFQEDLATAIDRLREAGVITTQTFGQWSRLLAGGFVDFVRNRGNNVMKIIRVKGRLRTDYKTSFFFYE